MGGHDGEGAAGGRRRRPIEIGRKLPLIRSQKEVTLDDDTSVGGFMVRIRPSHASWMHIGPRQIFPPFFLSAAG